MNTRLDIRTLAARRPSLAALLLVFLLASATLRSAAQTGVTIVTAGKTVSITGPEYHARLSEGRLSSITVRDTEFLDGVTPAGFFRDRSLPLPNVTVNGDTVVATDGTFTLTYRFRAGEIAVTPTHAARVDAAYLLVASKTVAYVTDLRYSTLAAAPHDADWGDVALAAPTGEVLNLRGGTRIWGRAVGRQAWELSGLLPTDAARGAAPAPTVTISPSRQAPPRPTLAHLTRMALTVLPSDLLVAAGAPADVQLRFENNADERIETTALLRITDTQGTVLTEERRPLTCAPHDVATLSLVAQPTNPDFYTVTCAISLAGAGTRTASAGFAYRIHNIALSGAGTATAYAPPADFAAYWDRVVADARAAPADIFIGDERRGYPPNVLVHDVQLVIGEARCHGWLAEPRFPGRFPVILNIPSDHSSDIRPAETLAALGFVVLTIEPTGQWVGRRVTPLVRQAFTSPADPALFGFRGVVIRYLQALDAVARGRIPNADPDRIAVTGVGFGGALSIMLGALDSRVQAVAPDVPSYLYVALGAEARDWPYLVLIPYLREKPSEIPAVLATLRYYDAAHFAARLDCPVLLSAGVTDRYCRPATIASFANALPGPKSLRVYNAGHEGGGDEHWKAKMDWLAHVLGGPSPAGPDAGPA